MSAQLSLDRSKAQLEVSVIIPTYNRYDSLLETLASFSNQTLVASRFEVIVVDDGSTDTTPRIASLSYPFDLRYVVQQNLGAAAARNHGAEISRGRVLVFIDDDITLDPGYLQAILEVCHEEQKLISMGEFLPYLTGQDSTFTLLHPHIIPTRTADQIDQPVSFTECVSNNLAVGRQHFFDVGKWHDVFGDGPTLWGDVEFGYRAWKCGFKFLKAASAKLYHRDHTIMNLTASCERNYHISSMVHTLIQQHPEIMQCLTMFQDKHPISFSSDSPHLIARKVIRIITSSRLCVWAMKRLAHLLETRAPKSLLFVLLCRWIISAYIYKGYRHGLRKLAEA